MNYAPPAFEQKIRDPALAGPTSIVAYALALPRPRVFTNGVFDVLHRGHVTYLAQARALGASLIVALNTDASTRRLGKGAERPINPLENRAAVIAALQDVSAVTWFDEDTPIELIRLLRPEVLVKGGDWKPEAMVGAADVQSWGGAVHSIPFLHQTSTTATIEAIRKNIIKSNT